MYEDHPISEILCKRIVILDGSMGALLFGKKLEEPDYRGERLKDHPHPLKNNPDILNLTQPDLIASIHDAYLNAGADIIETNTFTATAIAQADYHAEHLVREINIAAAKLAKSAAKRAMDLDPSRPKFVAGALGPLNMT